METPKPITGPYRATRLVSFLLMLTSFDSYIYLVHSVSQWNEAIRTFNNGVPRKRHWRQLRQYENCFTARYFAKLY